MARPHKIWYRQSRKLWYVQIDGIQHNLGPDEREAQRQFHEIMSKRPQPVTQDSLAELLDAFVVFSYEAKAKRTAEWYEDYLQDFLDYLTSKGKRPGVIRPDKITPKEVRRWVNDRGTATRARITAVKAAFRWGKREGWMVDNPLADMSRPPIKQRTEYVSPQDFFRLLLHVPDHCFFQLLVFCWDVGCRPQEAKALHKRHLDLANHRAVFPKEESKGKKRPRVIYFTERAERIVKENIRDGYVFLNARGQKWTANAVRCRFKRLQEKIGKRYCQYLLRHAWTTRKLLAGEDSHVIAELAGHSDTRMLESHYSKIRQHDGFLLEAARRKA